mgnify:FL=1|tara:strand:- start:708 stop:881 length:174 start_codon:yes stop_codon:yes gene_type:complete
MNDNLWKDINWGMIILIVLNAFYWVNVWWYGFFVPTIVTIVVAAIVGIVMKLKEERW